MKSAADGAGWSLRIDDGEILVVSSPPDVTANARHAVETLIVPLGLRVSDFENFLEEWRRLEHEFSDEYSITTPSASAVRVSKAEVELQDFWGQFEDCVIESERFEGVIELAVRLLRASDVASG